MYASGMGEMLWWGNVKEVDHLEDLGVDKIMLKSLKNVW
jgi:hypothetical protein